MEDNDIKLKCCCPMATGSIPKNLRVVYSPIELKDRIIHSEILLSNEGFERVTDEGGLQVVEI